MAAAAPPSPAATLAGLLALGAHALPPLQVPTAAPRTLYGRLIAGDAGFWAAFLQGPHMPHGLTYFQPLPVAFVTDAGGIAELLAWRMDAHGALRHVGWSEAAVAEWGRGRLVKLVAFEAQAQQAPPPATWDTVLFTALPAAAAAAATTAAAGSASVWSAAAAENSRFVSVLQQGRALVEKAVAWPQRSASVSEFLAGHDAGAPNWGCATRRARSCAGLCSGAPAVKQEQGACCRLLLGKLGD